jgi:multiple sugar transport system substrate-binding protein
MHAQVVGFGPVIPKGAKNVAAAKEFIKYMLEPKVLNQYPKGSLGRFAIPMPEIAKSDRFWLQEDPQRTVHTDQTLFGPTLPIY